MSTKRNALNKDAKKEPACSHQPGQSAFKAILPEEIDWKPFAAFPASGRLAIAVGEPIQKGPYMVRVKLPGGEKFVGPDDSGAN
jgi:hypothetical protein